MASISPPEHIAGVLRTLEDAGFAAYLVGGCVRDSVLGRTPTDWDVATSASPDETARVFPRTVLTGARYGTVTVLLPECPVEVTTFRTDGEYRDGRRPESVAFVAELPYDLSRRDFTMNAMALSHSGKLIDPYHGAGDIESRVIRCVGDPDRRFSEDALRMLRALRFSAQLGFTVEPGTLAAIERLAATAAALSAERVQTEIQKTLLSERPQIMADMLKYGLLSRYVNDSRNIPENFSKISKLPPDRALRWCALCAILLEAGLISSAPAFTRALRLDNKTATSCAVGAELAVSGVPKDHAAIKRLLFAHGEAAAHGAAAAHEVLYSEPRRDAVQAVINSGECYKTSGLAVTGQDLLNIGIPPGKQIGAALEALLLHVIEHPGDNNRENLIKLITVNC